MFENPYLNQQLTEARIKDAQVEAGQYRLAKGAKGGRMRLVALLSTVLYFIIQL